MDKKRQGHSDLIGCMNTQRHRYKRRGMIPLSKHTEFDPVSRSLCHNCSEMDPYKQTHTVWYTIT